MRLVLTDGRDLESLLLGIEGLVLAIEQRVTALESAPEPEPASEPEPDPDLEPTAPTDEVHNQTSWTWPTFS